MKALAFVVVVMPFAGLLFAACAVPAESATEKWTTEEALALDETAPRGDRCRDACYAAYDRALVVCSRKPTPKKRELCRKEAMEILATCMSRCPDGHRDLDDEGALTITPAWTTSSPNES